MPTSIDTGTVAVIVIVILALLLVSRMVRIVPQSHVYVVERFGKYERVLLPGLKIIVPFLQQVAHKVSVLERQLPTNKISVITKDNVELALQVSVFYRVVNPEKTVYRIQNIDGAIATTTTSIIRAACGKLEFDEVQSKRAFLNDEIKTELQGATAIWGVEITRTEILDVAVDDLTKRSMQQQLNAERERRAQVTHAEGQRTAVQLAADANLYRVQKEAEAVRVKADADAYATRTVAEAIAANGQAAIDFEIMKRKIDAIGDLASSPNAKTLVLPTDITTMIGGLETFTELFRRKETK